MDNTLKKCNICGELKPLEKFHRENGCPDGRRGECILCRSIKHKKYYYDNKEEKNKSSRDYHHRNRDRILKNLRENHFKNRAERLAKQREYYQKNKDSIKKRTRLYALENKEKVNKASSEYVNKRRKTDLKFALTSRVRRGVSNSLKNGSKNRRRWEELVGYSASQLKARLSKTMPSGYNWSDFLNGRLHIDHIVPISAFNFKCPEDIDFLRCWDLKNLRLLPPKENRKKSDKCDAFQLSIPGV